MGDQDVDAVEVQPHLNSFISLCAQPLMIYTQFCFFSSGMADHALRFGPYM